MLTLPIKRKWFDMILSGEKPEEYRDKTEYYETRFMNHFGYILINGKLVKADWLKEIKKEDRQPVVFRNGYSRNSPSFVAMCSLSVGTGNPERGAEKGKEYYKLKIHEIIRKDGVYECKSGYILR